MGVGQRSVPFLLAMVLEPGTSEGVPRAGIRSCIDLVPKPRGIRQEPQGPGFGSGLQGKPHEGRERVSPGV